MTRPGLVLVPAALLSGVLVAAAALVPVPYVSLGPGPTYNTLGTVATGEDGEERPLIEVQGRETFPTEGRIDLTTVGVASGLTMWEAVVDWVDRDLAVVPREHVYPPDRSDEQVAEENREQFAESQETATTAALRELGLYAVTVEGVKPGSGADGLLRRGDRLLEVDGQPVRGVPGLRELVGGRSVGDVADVVVERDGNRVTLAVPLSLDEDSDPPRSALGVAVSEEVGFTVDIRLDEVGGPSAGLAFALGVVDKLTPGALTGGKYVAATGAIDAVGNVSPIGGITQKLIAARRKGADVFLVPAANCAEAVRGAPEGLPLAEVATLRDALDALAAVREGRTPELCDRT